jgi:hypothetical protein
VNLGAIIAALQSYVSQHPTGGAACILLPANEKSIVRSDFRAITQAEVRDDEIVIAMGEPIFTTSPNDGISASELLKQLVELSDWSKRWVAISRGVEKIDEDCSIDFHDPVRNTGVLTAPEGETFLLIAELPKAP